MAHGGLALDGVERRGRFGRVDRAMGGEDPGDRDRRRLRVMMYGVDLDTVAGGKNQRLADPRLSEQPEEIAVFGFVDVDAFAEGQRCRTVVRANHHQPRGFPPRAGHGAATGSGRAGPRAP